MINYENSPYQLRFVYNLLVGNLQTDFYIHWITKRIIVLYIKIQSTLNTKFMRDKIIWTTNGLDIIFSV